MQRYIAISLIFALGFLSLSDNVPPTDITGKSYYFSGKFGNSDNTCSDCVQLTEGCLFQVYGRVCSKFNFLSWPDNCHQDYEGYSCSISISISGFSQTGVYGTEGQTCVTPVNNQVSVKFWEIYLAPGIYTITYTYNRSNPHVDLDNIGRYLGGEAYVSFSYYGKCPNTSRCNRTTCPICSTEYCASHENHVTGYVTHSQLGVAGDTYHYHCSNSQVMLDQWRSQLRGTCDQCNATYCKICGHTCEGLEVGCPNGLYCQLATCNICHGRFCAKHNIHLCSGFSYYSGSGEYEPFTVQTSILGQAQVSVNINANSRLMENIALDTATLNVQTGDILTESRSHTNYLSSIKTTVSDIENAFNTHSGKIQGLGTAIKDTLNDILSTNTVVKNNMQSVIYSVEANSSSVNRVNENLVDVRDNVRSAVTVLNNGFVSIDENQVIGLGIQNSIDENVSTGLQHILSIKDYCSALDSKMTQDLEKVTRLVQSGVYTEQELADIKDSIELVAANQVTANDVIVGKIGQGIEAHYAVVSSLPSKLDNIADSLDRISDPDLSGVESLLSDIADNTSAISSIADNTSDIGSIADSASSIDDKLDSTNSIMNAFRSEVNQKLASSLANQSLANDKFDSIVSSLDDILDTLTAGGSGGDIGDFNDSRLNVGDYQPAFTIGQSFARCRNKLIPDFGNISGDNIIHFTVPSSIASLTRSGGGYSYDFNLLDERLEPLFNCSRAICIFGYCLSCIYACFKVVRQY